MPTQNHPITIGIIGAGISGLSLAASLHRLPHLSIQVYESDAEFRRYGSGLAMHANAMQGLEMLGPEILKAYTQRSRSMTDDDEVEIATQIILGAGESKGTLVAELGRARARKCISRFDLLTGLAELLPWERVHFGKRLARIEEGVEQGEESKIRLHFRDGTASMVDCVIGADGVYSFVRQYLLGLDDSATHPKNRLSLAMWNRLVPVKEVDDSIDRDRLLQPCIICGPIGCIVCMPINRGKHLSISVMQSSSFGKPGEEPFDVVRYKSYTAEAQAIVKLVEKNPEEPWVLQDHDPARHYNRRRVVMMGDAAHATLPANGQGAAQAVEDAVVLKTLFAEIDHVSQISTAFQAFDEVRRPRSQRVTEIAREFTEIYLYRFRDICDDSERIRKHLGPAGAFTNAFDPRDQNAAALEAFRARVVK